MQLNRIRSLHVLLDGKKGYELGFMLCLGIEMGNREQTLCRIYLLLSPTKYPKYSSI